MGYIFLIVFLSLTIVIHFLFARAIRSDGDRLELQGQATWFVAPVVWAAATLLSGLPTVLVYWLMHHSSLAVQPQKPAE